MQKDGRVFQAGEDLIEEITSHAEAFAVEASLEGAVRIAPAAALMRSAHLLDEAIACARVGAAEALCLAIRSLVETTLYGHYLLAEGLDALQRMAAEQADQIQRIGRRLDSSQEKITQAVEGLVGLPGPHTLATIAERVDRAAGVPEGVKGLAQQGTTRCTGRCPTSWRTAASGSSTTMSTTRAPTFASMYAPCR